MLTDGWARAGVTVRNLTLERDRAYAIRIAFVLLGMTHAAMLAGHFAPDHWRCLHDGVCLPQALPGEPWKNTPGLWAPYFVWDAGQYDDISRDWYGVPASGGSHSMAFWPLWPLVLSIVRGVTPGLTTLRVMVVLAASAIAAISVLAFHALAQQMLARNQARQATLLYAFYPGAHFLIQSYPTGLLNLLVCLFLMALLRQRFWEAAMWSGIATATAPLGLTLPITLGAYGLIHSLRLHRSSRMQAYAIRAAQCALAISGMCAFMGILYWRTGNPIAFVTAKAIWSQPRSLVSRAESWFHIELVVTNFLAAFKHIGRLWEQRHSVNPTAGWETKLNQLCIGVALTSIYAGLRRLPAQVTFQAWLLVALYVWLIATLQDAEASMRLLYAAPGVFIAIAWVTRDRPRLGHGIAALSLLVLLVESFLSGAGYWVV